MKKNFKFYLTAGIFCFLVTATACTNYNEEELYGLNPEAACETGIVSFKNDIQPIMQNACISCHATGFASDGIILDTHAGVRNAAIERNSLVPSIKHASGFTPMPLFSAKLPVCDIAKIEAWVKAGALNN